MKALKIVLVVFGFVFTLLTLFSVSNVEAMEYLGDYCFKVEGDTEADDNKFDMRLAVVHIGNQHYSLYGKAEMVNFDGEGAFHGNAEIGSDGKITSTIVGSMGDGTEEMFSVTVNMKFDSISHGRFQWIVHAQEGGDLDSVYEEGDVTKVPCNDDAWPHL